MGSLVQGQSESALPQVSSYELVEFQVLWVGQEAAIEISKSVELGPCVAHASLKVEDPSMPRMRNEDFAVKAIRMLHQSIACASCRQRHGLHHMCIHVIEVGTMSLIPMQLTLLRVGDLMSAPELIHLLHEGMELR